MSTRASFRQTIRTWINFNIDDALIDSWIDMAIERLNNELRHKDMIERDVGLFTDDAAYLPHDWLELLYVRFVGERPARFASNDQFWGDYTPEPSSNYSQRVYTIIGNSLHIYPAADPETGKQIEIGYYKELPPYSDDEAQNAFYDKYPRIITFATLSMSAPYLIEDERVATWEGQAAGLLGNMNNASKTARFSGSPLRIRTIRSFG